MNGNLVVAAVAGVLVLGGLATIGIQTAITGDNPATSDPGDRSRVYHLDPGDCFDAGPTLERNAEVTVVACADAHDSEVIDVRSFNTWRSHDFDKAWAEAGDECTDEIDEYVAALSDETDVELRLYLPDSGRRPIGKGFGERRWLVACVAWSPTGRF